ncbi:CsoS2 family carboxysome shell protein [Prochlorococcus sp. MIT 1223]|uniref:carboxysome assembly protein CsoS2 n=1 Tax=Prochlorococcus sp. MIT 1223 TaxID=3096217 RepID=UPI002A763EAC|nr:CsoS2 family carboxysome shell protein [Prochlorococcus sp. MIT 1223]
MANKSSRELALERRKALSDGGKKASVLHASSPNRVRSAIDARVTRTDQSYLKKNANKPSSSPGRHDSILSASNSAPKMSASSNRRIQPISNPSRDLVLARRVALSTKGKSASTSKDRTRGDLARTSSPSYPATTPASTTKSGSSCQKENSKDAKPTINTVKTSSLSKTSGGRRNVQKRRPIENSSRALVLARREALSKHGKSAGHKATSAASVARHGNPDLSSREIALRVRELRSKSGATGKQRSGGTRPCGPNRNGSKQKATPDAHWKVGVSETSSGQVVTGTQANRSVKTTGNESSTCRSVTGTQYVGVDTIETFCKSSPSYKQPSKVGVTNTSHGNVVTGNEVGRSEKVTGDEPGTCKNLTGTEYISANQSNEYCGAVNQSPRKVGHSQTLDGRSVTGVMVGRSSNVTGNEAGSGRGLTGDQYIGDDPIPSGRPAQKVGSLNTVRGSGVTGTDVARSEWVTGNEAGSCKRVTGDEYVGAEQYQSFCGNKPAPEAAKVGLSLTNKSQSVSGTMTGRSELVTGDEPGSNKAVTGTPYAGLEQSSQFGNASNTKEIQQRTPKRLGTPGSNLTGLQPGIGGVMTGAEKGACEPLTGTPYIGGDQLDKACGTSSVGIDSNEPNNAPWTEFSVQSPARSAQGNREKASSVTGNRYEDSSRITGPFDMAANKITGTEQFRFDNKEFQQKQLNKEAAIDVNKSEQVKESRPVSRVTGEGQSAGLNITGDDWDRGDSVTGTEGVSARRRNPSRPGGRTAMREFEAKRNQELPEPDFLITGSSGNTRDGQMVTFSGGARG